MKRPTWDIPDEPIFTTCELKIPLQAFLSTRSIKSKRKRNEVRKQLRRHSECTKTYEIIDNDKLFLRKGDIFKFEETPCVGKLPLYAIGQFGVILERYRIFKQKSIGSFNDYGAVVMMLSGKRKGHIAKFSSSKMAKCDSLINGDLEEL